SRVPPFEPRAADDREGPPGADAEDVAQGDVQPLVAGKVDTGDPCHRSPFLSLALALPLLVPRVRADDHDPTAAPDHPAPVTYPLDARSDLHRVPYLNRYTTRPLVRSYGDSSNLTRSPGRIRM